MQRFTERKTPFPSNQRQHNDCFQHDEVSSLSESYERFSRLLNLNDALFEYHCQLCLTTLQNLMDNEQFFNIPSDKFKINVLIRCLQSNKDIQTLQLCLNVLSKAAVLYPTQVLHSVMHIFTFIGGNMLRIDNEYTYKIIEKTITTIIPVLIKVGNYFFFFFFFGGGFVLLGFCYICIRKRLGL